VLLRVVVSRVSIIILVIFDNSILLHREIRIYFLDLLAPLAARGLKGSLRQRYLATFEPLSPLLSSPRSHKLATFNKHS
jgi:hypothetical protein